VPVVLQNLVFNVCLCLVKVPTLLLHLLTPNPEPQDMGGAALVLGLAHVIMALRLPVRLRVLIPAVENAISGNSYRPLDVLNTRAGITVEVHLRPNAAWLCIEMLH
jgi:hypothetical protein